MKYELFNADCLEKMKDIPDKSVDLILCDLPYGVLNCKWDSIIDFNSLWQQYKRILKDDSTVALFGSEPFSTKIRESCLDRFKYDWIWDKKSSGNAMIGKYQPLKTYEIISIFQLGKTKYYPVLEFGYKNRTNEKSATQKSDTFSGFKKGFIKSEKNKPGDSRYPKAIIELSKQSTECCNSKAVHPTQKPVALLEYLIKTYTNENETVVDNCMGSGSTGVACVNTNRNFIGIEKDAHYFEIAENRIKEAEKNKASQFDFGEIA